MKRLKSTVANLRKIFEECITLQYIAEELVSFDISCSSAEVKEEMEKRNFDIVGVSDGGRVIGYVEKNVLNERTLKKYYKRFPKHLLIREDMPMLPGIHLLIDNPYIITMGKKEEYYGIITRGDLQKAPIRMWLFGLISMLEMNFLYIIRTVYPDGSWIQFLSPGRLSKANDEFCIKQTQNMSLDLIDCLQWVDLISIICKSTALYQTLINCPKKDFEKLTHKIIKLRNDLAHSHDLNANDWPKLIILAQEIEKLIVDCENIELLTLHKKLIT